MAAQKNETLTKPNPASDLRFKVIHTKMAVRALPSTEADILAVALKDEFFSGKKFDINGHPWLSISPKNIKQKKWACSEAWILIHGASVGLGDLLRPVHGDVEILEDLLWNLGANRGERVRPLVCALGKMGLLTGTNVLEATNTAAKQMYVQSFLEREIESPLPMTLAHCLRIAVEDSRLDYHGFPRPPPWTKMHILFTAPHSLPLRRPGHRPHVPEAYTSFLARNFAAIVGGAYLTWAQSEEQRAKAHFRRMGDPDSSNDDPNFTDVNHLGLSSWTRNLREIKSRFNTDRPCLHVDLHGCKDPGLTEGSHLVIGLGAMELKKKSSQSNHYDVETFRTYLDMVFGLVLSGWSVNLRPQKQLTGASSDSNHVTLSQQSLSEDGGAWMWSVQFEMSRTLRKYLYDCSEVRTLFAQGIMFAWVMASHHGLPEKEKFTHKLGYWIATCRSARSRYVGAPLPSGKDIISKGLDMKVSTTPSVLEDESCKLLDEELEDESGEAIATSQTRLLEDEREEESGEVTANTEAQPPLFDGSIKDLETNLLKVASDMEKFKGAGEFQILQYPTLTTCLGNWLQSSLNCPRNKYFISGSWDDFAQPTAMIWDGFRFVHTIDVHIPHWSTFQILIEGNSETTLYPSLQNATTDTRHFICGPDKNAYGLCWCIRADEDEITSMERRNARGEGVQRYQIFLWVNIKKEVLRVTWEKCYVAQLDAAASRRSTSQMREDQPENSNGSLESVSEHLKNYCCMRDR